MLVYKNRFIVKNLIFNFVKYIKTLFENTQNDDDNNNNNNNNNNNIHRKCLQVECSYS